MSKNQPKISSKSIKIPKIDTFSIKSHFNRRNLVQNVEKIETIHSHSMCLISQK